MTLTTMETVNRGIAYRYNPISHPNTNRDKYATRRIGTRDDRRQISIQDLSGFCIYPIVREFRVDGRFIFHYLTKVYSRVGCHWPVVTPASCSLHTNAGNVPLVRKSHPFINESSAPDTTKLASDQSPDPRRKNEIQASVGVPPRRLCAGHGPVSWMGLPPAECGRQMANPPSDWLATICFQEKRKFARRGGRWFRSAIQQHRCTYCNCLIQRVQKGIRRKASETPKT